MAVLRSSPRAALSRPWPLRAEAGFVALVLVAWQAIRIPLEGSVATSLEHARAELRVEGALRIDVERAVVHALDRPMLSDAMDWFYGNAHVPVLVGFLMLARVAAPQRYPFLRLTFALSFVPAALVNGLYPVAPPRFLPELGGTPPTDAELTGSVDQLLHNTTAAAASQHFGFAVFVAAGALWLWPRSTAARLSVLYPVAVLLVIVATSNHYLLDCVIGTAALGLGALGARRLVLAPGGYDAVEGAASSAAAAAVGYALLAWSLLSIHGLASSDGPAIALALFTGLVLVAGAPDAGEPAPATRG
jgi:PAP2 superfamily